MGAASRLSSHVLCITIVCRPPMKIWRARAAPAQQRARQNAPPGPDDPHDLAALAAVQRTPSGDLQWGLKNKQRWGLAVTQHTQAAMGLSSAARTSALYSSSARLLSAT